MSNTDPPAVDMDVDAPAGTLKRCSSAPMINENSEMVTTPPVVTTSVREQPQVFNPFMNSQNPPRTRRFSTSFTPVPGSPVSGLRLTPRINQLRQEEHADISNAREMAHERVMQHTIQISHSCEDLSLMGLGDGSPAERRLHPIHIALPCSPSPSPTRLCSPGFQSPTRASRTFIRRSCSPVLKPSPLGHPVKRKLDDDHHEFHLSPRSKRFHSYTPLGDRPPGGGLLTTSSIGGPGSLPGSLSSVGTPESLSSGDSPGGFNFRSNDSPPPQGGLRGHEPMKIGDNDITDGAS